MIYYISWFISRNDQYSPNPVMTFKTYVKLQTQDTFMLIERSYSIHKRYPKQTQACLEVPLCTYMLPPTNTHIFQRPYSVHTYFNKDSHLLRGFTMEMGAMSHKDLTFSWGPILYIQFTPNKDSKTFYSQTSYSGPTCCLKQKHIFQRPHSVHTCYI